MKSLPRLFAATIASFCLFNSLPPVLTEHTAWDQAAYAQRSGGRSRSGSFDRKPSSPSRSNDGGSGSNNGGSYGGGYGGGYGGPVVYGGYGSPIGSGVLLLMGLIVVGGIGLALWYVIWANRGGKGSSAANRELDNDVVTVSKIQVALLAQDKAIQPQLAELVSSADLSTSEGRSHHVQEAALALLRSPENWSHVQAKSETLKSREQGRSRFEEWSMAERTKYSQETLTNVAGQLARKDFEVNPDKDPASYIVVTLLLGTADDKPLFDEVRTTESLKQVLSKIASVHPDYLLVFELLWTPQAEGDSLTYDELLTEYADMLQI
jgi:uncharacterized membrane protein